MLCRSIAVKGFDNIVKLIDGAQMAEIRIEETGLDPKMVKALFAMHHNLLATCRPEKLSDNERKSLLMAAIDGGAKWVDIEIESDKNFTSQIVDYAKKAGCKVIISYHNYQCTPTLEQLNSIVKQAFDHDADLVKVATMVNNNTDNAKLLSLYNNNFPILAIGMGTLGAITRVAAIKLGAPFTFVSCQNIGATAPGQLSETDMKNILLYL